MKSIRRTCGAAALAALLPFAAMAVPLSDADDTAWEAVSATLNVSVTKATGALNAGGSMDFGIYDLSDPTMKTVLFSGNMSVGDVASQSLTVGSTFGFYVENTSNTFNGPAVYFSNSALNPNGANAMFAEDLGGGLFELEFEDAFFDTFTPGSGDLSFQVRGVGVSVPAVPLPASLGLLGAALGGLVLMRRR